jgi:DNA-binding NarL/FixJ family response regulator
VTDAGISVIVADDEADVRLLLRLQLESRGFDVVGDAPNGRQALDQLEATGADVIVMDLLMPGVSGIEAIAELRAERPGTKVIAYTAVAGDFVREQMERLGVPLLLKSGDIEPLAELIRALAAEEAPFSGG